MDLLVLFKKRASLVGSALRSRSLEFKAGLVRALSEEFKTELKQGLIKPMIDKVFPWGARLTRTGAWPPAATQGRSF